MRIIVVHMIILGGVYVRNEYPYLSMYVCMYVLCSTPKGQSVAEKKVAASSELELQNLDHINREAEEREERERVEQEREERRLEEVLTFIGPFYILHIYIPTCI